MQKSYNLLRAIQLYFVTNNTDFLLCDCQGLNALYLRASCAHTLTHNSLLFGLSRLLSRIGINKPPA